MKKETRFEELERELLSDDGIFCVREKHFMENLDRCALCGFELLPGEDAFALYSSGDIIHKSCWCEYADDNSSFFGKAFTVRDYDSDDFGRGEM